MADLHDNERHVGIVSAVAVWKLIGAGRKFGAGGDDKQAIIFRGSN
jgi:hypothetical protein